eukprot:Rhum_TRINITY_DN14643_c8_g1::Rhum_TRINITY_DN14643_c8_g1_i1::g.107414::m.107414
MAGSDAGPPPGVFAECCSATLVRRPSGSVGANEACAARCGRPLTDSADVWGCSACSLNFHRSWRAGTVSACFERHQRHSMRAHKSALATALLGAKDEDEDEEQGYTPELPPAPPRAPVPPPPKRRRSSNEGPRSPTFNPVPTIILPPVDDSSGRSHSPNRSDGSGSRPCRPLKRKRPPPLELRQRSHTPSISCGLDSTKANRGDQTLAADTLKALAYPLMITLYNNTDYVLRNGVVTPCCPCCNEPKPFTTAHAFPQRAVAKMQSSQVLFQGEAGATDVHVEVKFDVDIPSGSSFDVRTRTQEIRLFLHVTLDTDVVKLRRGGTATPGGTAWRAMSFDMGWQGRHTRLLLREVSSRIVEETNRTLQRYGFVQIGGMRFPEHDAAGPARAREDEWYWENLAKERGCNRARVYPASATPEVRFPELRERAPSGGATAGYPRIGLVERTSDSAICFSGGGSRAFMSSIGQLRALSYFGLIETTRYISSVSGGGWAASVFCFRDEILASEEQFLGELLYASGSEAPQSTFYEKQPTDWRNGGSRRQPPLTMRRLAKMPEQYMGHAIWEENPDWTFYLNVFQGGANAAGWSKEISKRFLHPFGIECERYMTWNQATLDDALERNDHLTDDDFVKQNDGKPFLVLNSVLIAPTEMMPVLPTSMQYSVFETTPLSCGVPKPLTQMTCKKEVPPQDAYGPLAPLLGKLWPAQNGIFEKDFTAFGGLVEPLGHNAMLESDDEDDGLTEECSRSSTSGVALRSRDSPMLRRAVFDDTAIPYTLQEAVGLSSLFYVGVVVHSLEMLSFLAPSYVYPPPCGLQPPASLPGASPAMGQPPLEQERSQAQTPLPPSARSTMGHCSDRSKEAPPATRWSFGDGGLVDNLGLISILRRKVKDIIVFDQAASGIRYWEVMARPGWEENFTKTGRTKEACPNGTNGDWSVDPCFQALFGFVSPSNFGVCYEGATVFSGRYEENGVVKEHLMLKIIKDWVAAAKAGRPVVSHTECVEVIDNEQHGVEAYTANITFFFLMKAPPLDVLVHPVLNPATGKLEEVPITYHDDPDAAMVDEEKWENPRHVGFNKYMAQDTWEEYIKGTIDSAFYLFPNYLTSGNHCTPIGVPMFTLGHKAVTTNLLTEFQAWTVTQWLEDDPWGRTVAARLREKEPRRPMYFPV